MLALSIYTTAFAALLITAETIVTLRERKYWPLSFDDYATAICLLVAVYAVPKSVSLPLLLVAWSFCSGNLYAMLFTRMDPTTGSRQRLPVLALGLVLSLIGTGMSFFQLIQSIAP